MLRADEVLAPRQADTISCWPPGSGNHMKPTSLTLLVATLALQCATASAENRVQNPDFDANLGSWTLQSGNGNFVLDSSTGDPAAPSAHLAVGESATVVSSCIGIDASSKVDFSLQARVNSQSCDVVVQTFDNATCANGNSSVPIFLVMLDTTWHTYSQPNVALASGTQSANIVIGGGDCNFDHVFLGPSTTTPVRLQAFGVD